MDPENRPLGYAAEPRSLRPSPAEDPLTPAPTAQEYREAMMNPWPGHSPDETIQRNRTSD